MKKIIGLVMMLCWVSFITSCNKTTSYTDMLKAEKKAIERLNGKATGARCSSGRAYIGKDCTRYKKTANGR